jgi:hypothetical protein
MSFPPDSVPKEQPELIKQAEAIGKKWPTCCGTDEKPL